MNNIIQVIKNAYRHSYPDKLEGNEDLKKAFWNGYMCRVVDEETEAIRVMDEASQYSDDAAVSAFKY